MAAFWTGLGCGGGGQGATDPGAGNDVAGVPDAAMTDPGVANDSGSPTDVLIPKGLLKPSDLQYLGAFRLPVEGGGDPAASWDWSGQAMTFFPDGDPSGPADGFPGSLFATGLDTECRVAEIAIPVPKVSKNLADLNVAILLQGFHDIRGGLFASLTELPRVALQYLPKQGGQTSGKLYLAWGQHFQEDPGTTQVPSHAWAETDLSHPATKGAWWVGNESLYSVNGYMFEIPQAWADAYTPGRRLATGRYRDGGWSGQGPSLFAIGPWNEGNPPVPGMHLPATPLLLYSNTRGEDSTHFTMQGYQHCDEWEGGAWLTAGDRSAVVFVGTKGVGKYCWYGWIHPSGDGSPCLDIDVDPEAGGYCFNADGSVCAASLKKTCTGWTSERGWWASAWAAQIAFYDPADLAAVAQGKKQPHEPQPYATLNIDDRMFRNAIAPDVVQVVGSGAQRRYRVGEVAYDREHGRLYVLERFADEARPVVHVWGVQ